MGVYQKQFSVDTAQGRVTYIDITKSIKETIAESGLHNGICTVVTAHTTCAVFFEEDSHDRDAQGTDFLQLDLNEGLEKIFPAHDSAEAYHYPGPAHYAAVASWPDAAAYLPDGDKRSLWNGDAHLKATLIGASETLAVVDGKLGIGTTGYVFFADFDQTRERTRKYRVIVIGE